MPLANRSWPIPALLAWVLAWGVYEATRNLLAAHWAVALGSACATSVVLSLWGPNWWRRAMIALGFPLSWLVAGTVPLPGWSWLVPLAVLALIYPLNAWRDAPLFPTPHNGLTTLATLAPLPAQARILDGGCGLGHGLLALKQAYPTAELNGIEWSWPLRLACGWRCPWARVWRGDLWAHDWRQFDMVYLFQRPESMAQAAEKAMAELRPGAWLVSLDFEATALQPTATSQTPTGQRIWLYQSPLKIW